MGTNTKNKTKSTQAVLATSLAAGALKHFPAGISMSVGGVTLTLTQIETQLTGFASLRIGVDTARAALQAKLAAEEAQATAMNAFLDAFVKIVRGSFGNQPDVLADFGLEPETVPTPLTVEQKRRQPRSARQRAPLGGPREARPSWPSRATSPE